MAMPEPAEKGPWRPSPRFRRRCRSRSGERLPLGPIKTVHVFWLAGHELRRLLDRRDRRHQPGHRRSAARHRAGDAEGHPPPSGSRRSNPARLSCSRSRTPLPGELGTLYVLVFEGSVADERIAQRTGGYFSAMGVEAVSGEAGHGEVSHPVPDGNVAASARARGGRDDRDRHMRDLGRYPVGCGQSDRLDEHHGFAGQGLPQRVRPALSSTFPACAPVRRQLHRNRVRNPAVSSGTRPAACVRRAGRPGVAVRTDRAPGLHPGGLLRRRQLRTSGHGDPECLVEIGCWGPVVNCNIVQRGAMNHMGGCMKAGGMCIGCTMPGFPDKFAPFYKTPPGAIVSHRTVARGRIGGASTAKDEHSERQPRTQMGRAQRHAQRMGTPHDRGR